MSITLSDDLKKLLDQLPEPAPGDECYGCHRPVPKKKADDRPGRATRSVVSISEPSGEEGTLENLMIAVIHKYQEQWPVEFAAMRNGIGLELVGNKGWKYRVLVFALYATLMVPGLAPTEEGQVIKQE